MFMTGVLLRLVIRVDAPTLGSAREVPRREETRWCLRGAPRGLSSGRADVRSQRWAPTPRIRRRPMPCRGVRPIRRPGDPGRPPGSIDSRQPQIGQDDLAFAISCHQHHVVCFASGRRHPLVDDPIAGRRPHWSDAADGSEPAGDAVFPAAIDLRHPDLLVRSSAVALTSLVGDFAAVWRPCQRRDSRWGDQGPRHRGPRRRGEWTRRATTRRGSDRSARSRWRAASRQATTPGRWPGGPTTRRRGRRRPLRPTPHFPLLIGRG